MKNNTNKIVFDNYLPKTSKQSEIKTSMLSYEKINNLYMNTYNKLISHLQKPPYEYESFIQSICYNLFQSNMYYTTQNNLIGLKFSTIIFSGPKDFFGYHASQSNVSEHYMDFNDSYFQKLYNLYYSYLKSYANTPYPYNNYIANVFKFTASNPELYNIFMNPTFVFEFINKEILFKDPYYKDYGFSHDVIEMLQRHRTSLYKLIPLLNALPKIMADSSFYTSAPCCSSNYSFNFSAKETYFHAYFSNDGIKYEINKNNYDKTSLIDLDTFSEINISQKCIDTLYAITGGIRQNLDNFSIICSLIMTNYYKNICYTLPSKNCSPLSLFIVYAPQDQAKLIRFWLEKILLPVFIQSDYQLKDITKTKNIMNLIMKNVMYPTYIPVKPSKSKETETQIKTIKKIIQRKENNIKDSNGLNHTLLNHLPVICFVDNPKQLSWLQANFKTKTFTFKPSPTLYVAEYKLKESKQLACFLSVYGLKLIYDTNFKNDTNVKWHEQTENITEHFIKDCLKIADGHICYADELYNIYTNYYALYYGNSPLTKICFTKELRKLLSDKSWPYQYKKPRQSRTDNRYAFVGINIDVKKAENAVICADDMIKGVNKQAFINCLTDMQNSVNAILQTLYHNIYAK